MGGHFLSRRTRYFVIVTTTHPYETITFAKRPMEQVVVEKKKLKKKKVEGFPSSNPKINPL